MLDLDHLTITKTKPKPKRKLATVNNCTETIDDADDNVNATTAVTDDTVTVATKRKKCHTQNATYVNRVTASITATPSTKPSSLNALPFTISSSSTSSSRKQCTYKHSTYIQHCLCIFLILNLPNCKYVHTKNARNCVIAGMTWPTLSLRLKKKNQSMHTRANTRFFSLFSVIFVHFSTVCFAGYNEKRLLSHLLDNYNTLERPVVNESDPLQISFGLTLMQIIDVDEKNQMLVTNIWLKLVSILIAV